MEITSCIFLTGPEKEPKSSSGPLMTKSKKDNLKCARIQAILVLVQTMSWYLFTYGYLSAYFYCSMCRRINNNNNVPGL
jgi:hypothetical protein